MRHLIIGQLLLSHGGIAAQDRPNVILVLTDDQGYGDLASQGNPFIQTPHLDRFYTESVRLTDFHVDPGGKFVAAKRGQSRSRERQDTPAPSRKSISSLSFCVRSASGSNPTCRY